MKLITALTLALVFTAIRGIKAQEFNEPSSLEDYLEYAALNNQNLQATYNVWKADLDVVPQAKTLADPMLEYEHYIVRMQERRSIGISQSIPWFGKLKDREDAASKKALASYYKYVSEHLKLSFELSKAYYEYYYIDRSIETTLKNIQLLKSIEQTATARYRSSQASQSDIVKTQVELLKLQDRLSELKDLLIPKTAQINSFLNRPAASIVNIPKEIKAFEFDLYLSDIINLARLNNPELKMFEASLAASESSISLAKKAYYPDFRFGISVMDMTSSSMGSDDDRNPVMLGVMLNIPIWRNKYSAGVREARSRYFAVSNRKLDKANEINTRISEAIFNYNDAQRKIRLYSQSLLILAEQSLNLAQADFRAGKGDLINLLDSQRMLFELELMYQKGITDKAIAFAMIDMLSGGVLNNKITGYKEND